MMIHEVMRKTGLTRKAIEYYADQGLIAPQVMENGYREFGDSDVSRLERIAAYRRLDVSVADIKRILDGDERRTLQEISIRRALCEQQERRKSELIGRLASGAALFEIEPQLHALEAGKAIYERLLNVFPGYFGRYFCLHFAQFLSEPIETDAQREAYETIVAWLDALPQIELDEELTAFLDDVGQEADVRQMGGMIEEVRHAAEHPEEFIGGHEEIIRAYLSMRETEEYKATPAARLMEKMKKIQQENGYCEVFIPAMERLSPTYAAYRERLCRADEVLRQMLEIKK